MIRARRTCSQRRKRLMIPRNRITTVTPIAKRVREWRSPVRSTTDWTKRATTQPSVPTTRPVSAAPRVCQGYFESSERTGAGPWDSCRLLWMTFEIEPSFTRSPVRRPCRGRGLGDRAPTDGDPPAAPRATAADGERASGDATWDTSLVLRGGALPRHLCYEAADNVFRCAGSALRR